MVMLKQEWTPQQMDHFFNKDHTLVQAMYLEQTSLNPNPNPNHSFNTLHTWGAWAAKSEPPYYYQKNFLEGIL